MADWLERRRVRAESEERMVDVTGRWRKATGALEAGADGGGSDRAWRKFGVAEAPMMKWDVGVLDTAGGRRASSSNLA